MNGKYEGYDFRPIEDLYGTERDGGLPISVRWMRAIDGSDVASTQTHKEHRHSFYELHFVLRGRMRYAYCGEEIEIPCGGMLLLPPEKPHRVAYYSEDFLKLSVAFVSSDEELDAALLRRSGRAERITERASAALAAASEEAARDTVYSPLIVEGRVFEILYELADIREKRRRPKEEQGTDIRLLRAKQFIRDNMHVFLGCEDVASYCYISAKQLTRLFRRYEGMTLLQYIHREKLRAAEELLREQERTVEEVSEALGFSSVYYFHAFFVKYRGVTPGQYRKKILG